jgi:hypothetical protein
VSRLCQDCHGNFELCATLPQWGHEWPAQPITFYACAGADADTMKSLLLGKSAELIGCFRIFRIYTAHPLNWRGYRFKTLAR